MHFLKFLLLFCLTRIASSKITCYRGMNIIMPGSANFSQNMASLGCNNANYCLRAFGTFNGKDGWFSTCASDETCKSFPGCDTVTGGSKDFVTNYTSCCCNTTLCNDLEFTGVKSSTKDTPGSADKTNIYFVMFYLFPLLNVFTLA